MNNIRFNSEKNNSLETENIFNLVNKNILKSDNESKLQLKKSIFNYSFSLLEKGIDKNGLKNNLIPLFTEINELGFNVKEIIKNDNINNTVNNLVINYHINKFKNTNSKLEKDIHFAKINNELESFVIKTVHKENMGKFDEDLVAAGTIGLFKALSGKYDPMVADFSTYSYMYIRKEIQEEKAKSNSLYNIPIIHDYYYSVYTKMYKEITGDNELSYNDGVIIDSVNKLQKNNKGVTVKLMKDIVAHKLRPGCSLETSMGSGDYGDDLNISDTLVATDYTEKDIKTNIDNQILRTHLNKFLSRYPDFEKTIIERKFGFDFGGDNTYPVYTIKVTRDGEENVKEMVAIKTKDAIKRVELLGYKVLSTTDEIEKTKRYETIVGGSIERLKDYFEIKKLTNISRTALKKSEDKIVKQLEDYLKNVMDEKNVVNTSINVTA